MPKPFLVVLALLALSLVPLAAQEVTPARPVDPDQVLPAPPSQPPVAPPVVPSSAPINPVPGGVTPDAPVAVTVVADSSLKQVLQALAQAWADTIDTGPQVPLTLTNAGTLRAKVENGVVWDVVICADVDDLKEMTDKKFLVAEGQRSLARNTLVLYGRKALVKDDDLDWFDMVGPEWKKVALGQPDLDISGRVAKHALQKHDLLNDDHKDNLVYAPTGELALDVVQREEADAVFAFKSELPKVTQPGFDIFPLKFEDAPPIFYIAAVSSQAKNPIQARAFIDYCTSETARAIWTKFGFETN